MNHIFKNPFTCFLELDFKGYVYIYLFLFLGGCVYLDGGGDMVGRGQGNLEVET